jgi:hypothetical protein
VATGKWEAVKRVKSIPFDMHERIPEESRFLPEFFN